jgi:hypothetical protein
MVFWPGLEVAGKWKSGFFGFLKDGMISWIVGKVSTPRSGILRKHPRISEG